MRHFQYTPEKDSQFEGTVRVSLPEFEQQMEYQEAMLEVNEKDKDVSPSVRNLRGLRHAVLEILPKHVEHVEIKRKWSDVNYSNLDDLKNDPAAREIVKALAMGMIYGFNDEPPTKPGLAGGNGDTDS